MGYRWGSCGIFDSRSRNPATSRAVKDELALVAGRQNDTEHGTAEGLDRSNKSVLKGLQAFEFACCRQTVRIRLSHSPHNVQPLRKAIAWESLRKVAKADQEWTAFVLTLGETLLNLREVHSARH